MIKVSVSFHKDGDHLRVYNVPGWVAAICLLCPYRLSAPWDWLDYLLWRWVSAMSNLEYKHETLLYEVPITDGCAASEAIWGKREDGFCLRNNCTIHPREEDDEGTDHGLQELDRSTSDTETDPGPVQSGGSCRSTGLPVNDRARGLPYWSRCDRKTLDWPADG